MQNCTTQLLGDKYKIYRGGLKKVLDTKKGNTM